MLVLFPCDPLRSRRVDAHFQPEQESARAAGHDVGLYDHDDLTVARLPGGDEPVFLRGWMLSSPRYAALEAAVSHAGRQLLTSAGQYRTAHEIPGWYETFRSLTPATVHVEGPAVAALASAASSLPAGAGVIKDYVKSLKHRWEEACFVRDVHDATAVHAIARRFLEVRGEDLQGGLVLRAFERFVGAEGRTWWVDDRCVAITAHPDTPQAHPELFDLDAIGEAVASLGCRAVTVDVARREDGVTRVVEVGDAQVSDRPLSTLADRLIDALLTA